MFPIPYRGQTPNLVKGQDLVFIKEAKMFKCERTMTDKNRSQQVSALVDQSIEKIGFWTELTKDNPKNCEGKNYRTLFEDQLINTPIVYKYYFSKSLFYFINCIVSHYQNYIYLLIKIEHYIAFSIKIGSYSLKHQKTYLTFNIYI